MIMTNKLLPVALVAALIGGSVGALVMHKTQPTAAETTAQDSMKFSSAVADPAAGSQMIPAEFNTSSEQTAYKTGFADGFDAAGRTRAASSTVTTPARAVSRNAAGRTTPARRVSYDYAKPASRSFWQKHQDKLTVGMGTGAGAAIGALIGGKKGAAIGALSGAGGSALYTYKIRKRNRN